LISLSINFWCKTKGLEGSGQWQNFPILLIWVLRLWWVNNQK
jgi:hypothetical protein